MKTNTKKKKKKKKKEVSCFVYPSVWAYVHADELKPQTSTLPGSEDYARPWAEGCLWAPGRAARREVWKACGRQSKKKPSSLWWADGAHRQQQVCGWVTASYNPAGTCYCLYSCRCSVWYTLNLNCRCWMCSGVKYVVCWSSLVSVPTLFIQSPDFSS